MLTPWRLLSDWGRRCFSKNIGRHEGRRLALLALLACHQWLPLLGALRGSLAASRILQIHELHPLHVCKLCIWIMWMTSRMHLRLLCIVDICLCIRQIHIARDRERIVRET